MTRAPVTSLSPLTKKQADWLFKQGERLGRHSNLDASSPYWIDYFSLSPTQWDNATADVTTPVVYEQFLQNLALALNKARTDRELWKRLKIEDSMPPDPPVRDPYGLPEYLSWWQAENAFRRGYSSVAEAVAMDKLKKELRSALGSDGVLVADDMRTLARRFQKDSALHLFFETLAADIAAHEDDEDYTPFEDGNALFKTIWGARTRAYQQFSPHYYPRTSRGGGGFFGIDPLGSWGR